METGKTGKIEVSQVYESRETVTSSTIPSEAIHTEANPSSEKPLHDHPGAAQSGASVAYVQFLENRCTAMNEDIGKQMKCIEDLKNDNKALKKAIYEMAVDDAKARIKKMKKKMKKGRIKKLRKRMNRLHRDITRKVPEMKIPPEVAAGLTDYRSDEASDERVTVICNGVRCEFYDSRINPQTVPDDRFVYYVRSDDDGQGIPATLERAVTVNFLGTIVSDVELIPAGKEYLVLNFTRFLSFGSNVDDNDDNEYMLSQMRPCYTVDWKDHWKFTELGRFEDTLADMGIMYVIEKVEDDDSRPMIDVVVSAFRSEPYHPIIKATFDAATGEFSAFGELPQEKES